MLLILYSAKRKGKGRELRSEDEEDAAPGGDDAQGLPFTTDEPEPRLCLQEFSCKTKYRKQFYSMVLLQYPVKPPAKEPTEPIDLVLHSDVRAVGRAKSDHRVSCILRCSLTVDELLRALHRLSSILQVADRASLWRR
jgi:hypothetical protein